jgi:hypothetical protein
MQYLETYLTTKHYLLILIKVNMPKKRILTKPKEKKATKKGKPGPKKKAKPKPQAKPKLPEIPAEWEHEFEEADEFYDNIPTPNQYFEEENELKRKLVKAEAKLVKFRDEQEKDLLKVMEKHEVEIKQHQIALQNTCDFYEQQISTLRGQIRELFEKNHEIHDTAKIFVKGLEHLSRDGVTVTMSHHWTRNGAKTLEDRIKELTGPGSGKRIVSVCPLITNPRGETVAALIITEHFERFKLEAKYG